MTLGAIAPILRVSAGHRARRHTGERWIMWYRIRNRVGGVVLGCWDARSEAAALDAFARDAGCEDYAHSCQVAPVEPGEMEVRPATLDDLAIADIDVPASRTRQTSAGETVEVLSLERYGTAGWKWTTRVRAPGSDRADVYASRTDSAGRGLWSVRGDTERQHAGTGQFALPTSRRAALRRLLAAS